MPKRNWPKGDYPQMARKPNAAQLAFNGKGPNAKLPTPPPEKVPEPEPIPEPEPRTLREKLEARRRRERGLTSTP